MAFRNSKHCRQPFLLCAVAVITLCTQVSAQDQPPAAGGNQKPAAKQGNLSDEPGATKYFDYSGQATLIVQHLFAFHSPYAGMNSLRSRQETELSQSYTLYLGARIGRQVEVYVNPELALGNGIGEGIGLAGYSNGDLIGQPSLRAEPYIARYFVRWRIPTGKGQTEEVPVGRAPNLIAVKIPAHRIVFTAGKFAVSDILDVNYFANNPRAQFLNKSFVNNTAYDFAQETRGYSLGASVAWVNPSFALRIATFAMPTTAGGPDLAYSLENSHGDQLEWELHPQILTGKRPNAIVRLLVFRNVAPMGRYRDALVLAAPGSAPDITQARRGSKEKFGFGFNYEQRFADDKPDGLFARLGWNDGAAESFAYAEADRTFSFGGQMSGAFWRRKDDKLAIAFAQNDLSSAHRDYLAAGGMGLTLGDGQLAYRPERIVEAYYSYQAFKQLALTLDYQFIANPGYNHQRGPISLVSFRAHLDF